MTRLTDEQILQRHKAAMIKIVEAKAHLWLIASFVATICTIGGLILLVAAFFKLVLG